jgi:predicted peptidase
MNKLILILAGAFLISCNEKKADSEQKQIPAALENIFDSSFKNDTIYPKVSCRMDNSNSYSLLLPMVYDTISKSPVLFFIDAHADGLLPVEKYKVLANQFGYILIGNNNSKNGNSFESNSIFINQMMEDTRKRFSIDEKRIYVCGFSGGSRVAG